MHLISDSIFLRTGAAFFLVSSRVRDSTYYRNRHNKATGSDVGVYHTSDGLLITTNHCTAVPFSIHKLQTRWLTFTQFTSNITLIVSASYFDARKQKIVVGGYAWA